MPRKEIEGEFVGGWPDRKRARPQIFKDVEGRVVSTRMPLLEMWQTCAGAPVMEDAAISSWSPSMLPAGSTWPIPRM